MSQCGTPASSENSGYFVAWQIPGRVLAPTFWSHLTPDREEMFVEAPRISCYWRRLVLHCWHVFFSSSAEQRWRLEPGGGSGCRGSHRSSGRPQLQQGLRTKQEVTSLESVVLWDCCHSFSAALIHVAVTMSACHIAPFSATVRRPRFRQNARDISKFWREKQ